MVQEVGSLGLGHVNMEGREPQATQMTFRVSDSYNWLDDNASH